MTVNTTVDGVGKPQASVGAGLRYREYDKLCL